MIAMVKKLILSLGWMNSPSRRADEED